MRPRPTWETDSILGEPEDEIYKITKAGTLALLKAVHAKDSVGKSAMSAKDEPCEAVRAYLDVSFLGPFLRSREEVPFMFNAGVLRTYIDFLDSELERGAIHATPLHQTYLKLLAYVTAIEASAPLAVYGNCLEFLASQRTRFEFDIYSGNPSAHVKRKAVSSAMTKLSDIPRDFQDLHDLLKTLIDRVYRNAIAHSTYRVRNDDEEVDIWEKGRVEITLTFDEVDKRFRHADSYRLGFTQGVSDFAYAIHPDCAYIWHSVAKY